MKRIRVKPTNKLIQFTYPCGCIYFVTMDMADRPPTHYHKGEFHHAKEDKP